MQLGEVLLYRAATTRLAPVLKQDADAEIGTKYSLAATAQWQCGPEVNIKAEVDET